MASALSKWKQQRALILLGLFWPSVTPIFVFAFSVAIHFALRVCVFCRVQVCNSLSLKFLAY